MVTPFDTLEADFFGDLAEDTHGLWEVFDFVRLHYPEFTDEQVFERGRDYITRWIDAGWIRISDAPLLPFYHHDSIGESEFFAAIRRGCYSVLGEFTVH